MPDFGALQKLDLRSVWPHEAGDFTPWLAEHLEALGAALGLDLELVTREADVGDFSLDILARDLSTGRNVIIENQLAPTDHDHLGKLLTYASAYDAFAVVWVAQEIRDEHRQALEWLNQRTGANTGFFGVIIEVIRIDSSKPAYTFKPVVFPNEWQKESAGEARPPSSRQEAYRHFFQALIDELRDRHHFTAARLGQAQNWYSFASGRSGISYSANFPKGGQTARVELYIDLGDVDATKALFDHLLARRSEVESAFGEPLEWERLDARRACRIASYFPGSISDTPERLAQVRAAMVDRLLRLKKAIGPLLAESTAT